MARKPRLNRKKGSRKGMVNLYRMGVGLRSKLFYWKQQDQRRDTHTT